MSKLSALRKMRALGISPVSSPLMPVSTHPRASIDPVIDPNPDPPTRPHKKRSRPQAATRASKAFDPIEDHIDRSAPLRSVDRVCRDAKQPVQPSDLNPYPSLPKHLEAPQEPCECCKGTSRFWFVEQPKAGWRYFYNGIAFAGPSPIPACSFACAKEMSSGQKVAKLISLG